jgi:hypothetical protein
VLFHNYCCRGKAISITYSECMFVAVVSVIQHMKPMRHIILSSVAYPVIKYFSTLCHKRTIFVKKSYWTWNVSWFSLQLLSEEFIYFQKNSAIVTINAYTSSCRVLVILVRCHWTLNFVDIFSKTQISNFVKIRAVGVELSHSCGRTDDETDGHDETSRFSQFCERA